MVAPLFRWIVVSIFVITKNSPKEWQKHSKDIWLASAHLGCQETGQERRDAHGSATHCCCYMSHAGPCWRDGGPAQTGALHRWAGGQDWFPRLPHSTQATPPSAHAILESTQHTLQSHQNNLNKEMIKSLCLFSEKILRKYFYVGGSWCSPLRDHHPNSVPPSWSVSHSPAQRNSKHPVKDLTQANDEPNYLENIKLQYFLLHLVFAAD